MDIVVSSLTLFHTAESSRWISIYQKDSNDQLYNVFAIKQMAQNREYTGYSYKKVNIRNNFMPIWNKY